MFTRRDRTRRAAFEARSNELASCARATEHHAVQRGWPGRKSSLQLDPRTKIYELLPPFRNLPKLFKTLTLFNSAVSAVALPGVGVERRLTSGCLTFERAISIELRQKSHPTLTLSDA